MIRVGQIGTKHGHALGKWLALRASPDVEIAGIWEPDRAARDERYLGARWVDSADVLLRDPAVVALAIEGRNDESLPMARAAVDAGKHIWFDKPAGEDWPAYQELMRVAAQRGLQVQMGYMFRYQPGFAQVASLARAGAFGDVFQIRAHMSTHIDEAARRVQSVHRGGILYDLAGHMIDQIVWLLGRPQKITTVLRNDATPTVPAYADNTVAVLEFEKALAIIDIAAMEARPLARRFEVHGTLGGVVTEPFDPGRSLRLVFERPWGAFAQGEHLMVLPEVSRQQLYERELAAFVATIRDGAPPDRPPEHDQLVQETLLRATGSLGVG
ncbi:MAG: Gfo/Idh/MocA family oxidoreductase [Chloroflexota bacterium]